MSAKPGCGVPGCEGPDDILGVCASCHRRWQDGDKAIEPYIQTKERKVKEESKGTPTSKPAAKAPSTSIAGLCRFPGCAEKTKSRGLCAKHYQRTKSANPATAREALRHLLPALPFADCARRADHAERKTVAKGEASPAPPLRSADQHALLAIIDTLYPMAAEKRGRVLRSAAIFLEVELGSPVPNA